MTAIYMKLIFATKNKGKAAELRHLVEGMDIDVETLLDYPDVIDVVEDGKTFRDNALKKAREMRGRFDEWILADDSGLAVDALGGEPGVKSARYAGKQGDYKANNEKLLREMKSIPAGRRQAAFVCTMVLAAPDGREWVVEGRCEGEIGFERRGDGGFGYDPLFFVPSEGKTMAELPMARKNEISHRGRAFSEIKKILVDILSKNRQS